MRLAAIFHSAHSFSLPLIRCTLFLPLFVIAARITLRKIVKETARHSRDRCEFVIALVNAPRSGYPWTNLVKFNGVTLTVFRDDRKISLGWLRDKWGVITRFIVYDLLCVLFIVFAIPPILLENPFLPKFFITFWIFIFLILIIFNLIFQSCLKSFKVTTIILLRLLWNVCWDVSNCQTSLFYRNTHQSAAHHGEICAGSLWALQFGGRARWTRRGNQQETVAGNHQGTPITS